MSNRLTQFGLVSLMSLLVLSWSTCPSLFVNAVRTLVGAEVHACASAESLPACCHEAEADPQEDEAPKRCPLCEKIGSMHALVTPDAPMVLVAPLPTLETIVASVALLPSLRAADRLQQIVRPPGEHFTTTVRFLC